MTRVIPLSCAVSQPYALRFVHVSTEKIARANTGKADAARSCGVNRHRHVNNEGHGAPNRTT